MHIYVCVTSRLRRNDAGLARRRPGEDPELADFLLKGAE